MDHVPRLRVRQGDGRRRHDVVRVGADPQQAVPRGKPRTHRPELRFRADELAKEIAVDPAAREAAGWVCARGRSRTTGPRRRRRERGDRRRGLRRGRGGAGGCERRVGGLAQDGAAGRVGPMFGSVADATRGARRARRSGVCRQRPAGSDGSQARRAAHALAAGVFARFGERAAGAEHAAAQGTGRGRRGDGGFRRRDRRRLREFGAAAGSGRDVRGHRGAR
mmetsp:Transcript_3105/g.12671  ORF Transcript_3105/g.12671 Transcript_3105/m.12671 type:complete len:222 (-) Transcript_3105:247-912(-)